MLFAQPDFLSEVPERIEDQKPVLGVYHAGLWLSLLKNVMFRAEYPFSDSRIGKDEILAVFHFKLLSNDDGVANRCVKAILF